MFSVFSKISSIHTHTNSGGCVVDGRDCGYGWCVADSKGDGCGGAVVVVGGGSGFGFGGG